MITMHYTGTSEPQTMRNLILELKAISEEMQWKYIIIDDENFIGILVTITKKCEPLSLIINNHGRLIHPAWLNEKNPADAAFYVSIKTHFSSIDTHIALVKLLKYIKKKYIHDLWVNDESEYYETGNSERLQQLWDILLEKLNLVTGILENSLTTDDKTLSPENLVAKIESIINGSFDQQADTRIITND